MASGIATIGTLTLDEWGRLPEDQPGELVDGRLEEEEMPDWVHDEVVMWLAEALRPWVRSRHGRVGGAAKLAVAPDRGRMPDVTVYLRAKPPRRGLIHIPPDIVVEVVSPTPRDVRRDRVEKLADYATFGVGQYWLLDPETRTFELLSLGEDGRYVHALAATGGKLEEIPRCPGLVIDLDALWAELDELDVER